jgi:glycosyltransferase involved in cell wall biosynthesis
VKRDARDVPVLNIVEPERSNRPPTVYARRREAMVGALAGCDSVLAVSRFVARKYEAAGVPRRLIRTMPIGSRIHEVIRQNPDVMFDPPPLRNAAGEARAVRVAFLGFNHFNKGLPLLADALELMSPERLRGIDLSVFANGGESIEWRFKRMEPRLGKLRMIHGYQFHDIPWCLGGIDLTYVGSTWWDPAPQTVFESFACGVPVLGAELGGIPDFVIDGVNGVLFRGNDAADLARRLGGIVDEPEMLLALRRNVRPPKDMAAHVVELEGVYGGEEGVGVGDAAEAEPVVVRGVNGVVRLPVVER